MPNIYMIAGPNGAGKTTSAMDLLPELLHCDEYINADVIASGLSPFNPESTAFQAGRLMLERIHELALNNKDFAFETTAASKSFAPFISNYKKQGYYIAVLFLWLHNPELALNRIAARVENNGHNVPPPIVRRRYRRGLNNFFNFYLPLADDWMVYDNSGTYPVMVARKKQNSDIIITDDDNWQLIKESVKL